MILVDPPIWKAHGRRFSHLVSDVSFEELHRFATALGLPQRAFHRDHYDLPDDWWDRAVAAGATPVDPREVVRRLRAAGLRRRGPVARGVDQDGTAAILAVDLVGPAVSRTSRSTSSASRSRSASAPPPTR